MTVNQHYPEAVATLDGSQISTWTIIKGEIALLLLLMGYEHLWCFSNLQGSQKNSSRLHCLVNEGNNRSEIQKEGPNL